VPIDRGDGREQDRGEEDEEAPEDERVHQPRHEPLQELALAEDDDRLGADAPAEVARAVRRLAAPDELPEEERAPREHRTRDRCERGQAERAGDDVYEPRAFRSSPEIAGTIACRSPITA